MTKTLAAVLVASTFWTPLAAHGAVAGKDSDDSISIIVEIPSRSGAPTPPPTATPAPTPTAAPTATAAPTPTVSPIATPAPAGPETDAGQRPGALPATGGEIALWAGVVGLLALAAGLVIRARRRSS
jgi:LPXTG-motif cell wall-anchored protein